MESEVMGRVLTDILVENLSDLLKADEGSLTMDQVRRLNVKDALVDTGSTTLDLPKSLIEKIGLRKSYEKVAITSQGKSKVAVYGPARVTIMDRFCSVDVMEVPEDVPPLVGQIPLEMLDLVIEPRSGRLTGNPAHDGEHVLELL